MEQSLGTPQLSVTTKQWLKQRLHEMRLQSGTYWLADRELARRAGLHVEEARRWLYGDYLPRPTSRMKFSRLLSAIGASEEECRNIIRQVGLETPPASADGTGDEAMPSAFRADDRLLFNLESPKTGRWEIAEWAGLHTFHTILEDVRRTVRCPALSADGRLLVTINERPSGERHLEVFAPGRQQRMRGQCMPLLHAGHGAWSPDGRAICCQVSTDLIYRFQAIVLYDPERQCSRRLTSGEFDDTGPAWSPVGDCIVFQRGGDLWSVDAESRNIRQVLSRQEDGGCRLSAPAFGPYGRRLAYIRQRDRYTAELCCLNLRANTATTLLSTPDVTYCDPCWSPDGEHLLVSSNRATGHNFELWLVNADGSNAQQVTAYGGNIRRPIWQPGRLIEHAPRPLRLV